LIEFYTFTQMGVDAELLTVLPLVPEEPAEVLESVKGFRLRHARCFDAATRDHLLEVIASGCGSEQAFERILRTHLSEAVTRGRRSRAGHNSVPLLRQFKTAQCSSVPARQVV
jgi:hypothetical protein